MKDSLLCSQKGGVFTSVGGGGKGIACINSNCFAKNIKKPINQDIKYPQ